MTEAQLQKSIITWCELCIRPDVIYWSTPNERNPKNMGNLPKMGIHGGIADLTFVFRDHVFSDLKVVFMELKRPTVFQIKNGKKTIKKRGGVQSKKQKVFEERCLALDVPYFVVDSLEYFIKLCRGYHLTKNA